MCQFDGYLFDADDVLVLTAECLDVVGVVSLSDWAWTLLLLPVRHFDLSADLPPGSDIFFGGRSSLKRRKQFFYRTSIWKRTVF